MPYSELTTDVHFPYVQHDACNGSAYGGTLRVPGAGHTLERHSPLCAVFSAPPGSLQLQQPPPIAPLLENAALVGLMQHTSDAVTYPLLHSQDSFTCALSSIV